MKNIVSNIIILDDVPDPKTCGLVSGYAPHHKFQNIDCLCSGVHTYMDGNIHYPGESLIAYINFPSWEFIEKKLKIGDEFEIYEMNRLIGRGKILSKQD